jgi:hypothetical protein
LLLVDAIVDHHVVGDEVVDAVDLDVVDPFCASRFDADNLLPGDAS